MAGGAFCTRVIAFKIYCKICALHRVVAVSKTSVPVLIIHGDKDKQAPVSMAYKIYDSCKSERELYIVSGSEHKDCYRSNPEKYESIVSEFLKKHIPTN